VADPDTLVPLETLSGRTVLLLAVRLGATRLIDNLVVER
jgi:pantothenate synthetase